MEENEKQSQNMTGQGRITLKMGIDKAAKPRKVARMINSVNHQSPKMNKAKSKEPPTQDSIWKKK
jgi:hypothetical protein